MKKIINYFSIHELIIWISSILLIVFSFVLFDKENYSMLIGSILGVTSLIFNAKGNPIGQILMVIFSIFYGIISYSFAYYGEMISYLLMTLPMSIIALISWLKNPYKDKKSEVKIKQINKKDIIIAFIITTIVTTIFYFILKILNTTNLFISTFSIFTSFLAVYLTYKRSQYYALAYACNDIVLIIMWTLASISDISYLSVVVCFLAFLINDIYGYFNWKKMKKRQIENL